MTFQEEGTSIEDYDEVNYVNSSDISHHRSLGSRSQKTEHQLAATQVRNCNVDSLSAGFCSGMKAPGISMTSASLMGQTFCGLLRFSVQLSNIFWEKVLWQKKQARRPNQK